MILLELENVWFYAYSAVHNKSVLWSIYVYQRSHFYVITFLHNTHAYVCLSVDALWTSKDSFSTYDFSFLLLYEYSSMKLSDID